MTITINNKKVKVRKLRPNKDKICEIDVWDTSPMYCNEFRYATEFPHEIGNLYLGTVPCYRPIKPTRKPSPKRAGVKAVEEKMPKWVSCRDKIPTESGNYLVTGYSENGDVSVSFFNVNLGVFAGYITHWMPLPNPPTRGTK